MELRLLLDHYFGGPGQRDDPNGRELCLPHAGEACKLRLVFDGPRMESLVPGPAFDGVEWERLADAITASLSTGEAKFGREYSFSSFRVVGAWRGEQSHVQICPPPPDAPTAEEESAEHPFILEVPVSASDLWALTNHRRLREHRRLTNLLNILLIGTTTIQPRRYRHYWAGIQHEGGEIRSQWSQEFYSGKLGSVTRDSLTPGAWEPLKVITSDEYYRLSGLDGLPLRVPDNLDQMIVSYQRLAPDLRAKFNRAAFWIDMAYRQWHVSVSASFIALATAIESPHEPGCPA